MLVRICKLAYLLCLCYNNKMSIHSFEHNRRRERHQLVERTKRQLARSVLLRVHEQIETDPEVTSFTVPVLRPERIALALLRDYPEIISRRVNIGRAVTLRLNEDVQPPELEIELGQWPDIGNES